MNYKLCFIFDFLICLINLCLLFVYLRVLGSIRLEVLKFKVFFFINVNLFVLIVNKFGDYLKVF